MHPLDKNILETLQKRADISNKELASINELAESSMLNRVNKLKERGVITSFRAIIDPKAIGYMVQAIIMINLDQHHDQSIEAIENELRSIPEVKLAYHVTGRYDYIIHVVLRDIEHLGKLSKESISKLPGLARQETFLILDSLKEDQGYSLDYVI